MMLWCPGASLRAGQAIQRGVAETRELHRVLAVGAEIHQLKML